VPQAPQFRLSLEVSTHSPLQTVIVVPLQVVPQTPLSQTCPDGHFSPHPSQLEGSLRSSAQYAEAPVPQMT
jgi:hypothetical protein